MRTWYNGIYTLFYFAVSWIISNFERDFAATAILAKMDRVGVKRWLFFAA